MANLNSRYGYMAVHQTDLPLDQRKKSLEEDYNKNLDAHAKAKKNLLILITGLWISCASISGLGAEWVWFVGFFLMNIVAFNYGAYADYQVIEESHYRAALDRLETGQ